MTGPRVLDVVLPTPSARIAGHVARALAVETTDAPQGARVTVRAEGADVHLHIEAAELRSLRAAAHGFLRWADASIAVALHAAP